MGLEIFCDLHAPADWHRDRVLAAIEVAHQTAVGLDFAEVDPIVPNLQDCPETISVQDAPDSLHGLRAKAEDGWIFRTWPGEGCETALFGLCRFPGTVMAGDRLIPTGWGEGWHHHTWCKTQYADRISRGHFLKCHLGIIAILDAFRSAGIEVNVRDGSGFWDHRDQDELIRQLDEWNGTVAAVAGAFKDALDQSAGRVVSPIFSAPDFEHLEAQGHETLRRKRDERTRVDP